MNRLPRMADEPLRQSDRDVRVEHTVDDRMAERVRAFIPAEEPLDEAVDLLTSACRAPTFRPEEPTAVRSRLAESPRSPPKSNPG